MKCERCDRDGCTYAELRAGKQACSHGFEHAADCGACYNDAVQMRIDSRAHTVDWRARAQAAEARVAELEGLLRHAETHE